MEKSSLLLSPLFAEAIPVTLPPETLHKLIFPLQALSARRLTAHTSTTCHYVSPFQSLQLTIFLETTSETNSNPESAPGKLRQTHKQKVDSDRVARVSPRW